MQGGTHLFSMWVGDGFLTIWMHVLDRTGAESKAEWIRTRVIEAYQAAHNAQPGSHQPPQLILEV